MKDCLFSSLFPPLALQPALKNVTNMAACAESTASWQPFSEQSGSPASQNQEESLALMPVDGENTVTSGEF